MVFFELWIWFIITECYNLNACYYFKKMKNVDWYYARDYCKKLGAKLFEPILPFQYAGLHPKIQREYKI